MSNKNYYQILGVAQDAEDFLIRAAYKALAQRYHPDKYQGSAEEAVSKMHEISEAYQTLSNYQKRKDYDAFLRASKGTQSEYQNKNESLAEEEKIWETALQFFPELENFVERLKLFSDEIANRFKTELSTTKKFGEAQSLANHLEQTFLEEHFGTDAKVINFTRQLFLDGNKAIAKEFNEMLIAVGSSVDVESIIHKIEDVYFPENSESRRVKRERISDKDQKINALLDDANNGNPEAQFKLGIFFENNGHVSQAIDWYRQSARQGHRKAWENLESLQRKDGIFSDPIVIFVVVVSILILAFIVFISS